MGSSGDRRNERSAPYPPTTTSGARNHPNTVSAGSNHPVSVPANSANQRLALVVGPPQQLGQLVVVDDKLRGADRADYCLAAVAASLTPLQHSADGVTIPLTEVLENGQDRGTETVGRLGFNALGIDHALPPPLRNR